MFGALFKKPKSYPGPVDQLRGEVWVVQGPRLGEKWSMDEGDLKVGRSMEDDEIAEAQGRAISFPDHCKFISGQHAVFKKQEDGYWIFDLGSKNGTNVGGRRVDKVRLMDGDEVDLGQVVLRIKISAPALETQRACALSIVKGPRQGERWELKDGELLVGRELEGEGVISFEGSVRDVSSEHAVFRRVKNGFWVQDKGSRNGTFVNGKRVESSEIKDGDRVVVGNVTFEARISG